MAKEKTKPKKCLVIGGNGFVGSYIVNSLAEKGSYEVVAYDRYSDGRIKHKQHQNIFAIKGDIYDINSLTKYINDVDYVFHSFSATTPAVSDSDPYIDIEKNLLNNVKIFDACAKSSVKKVIYMSSGGSIYGGEGSGREDDIIHPVSPYAISKFASERYLEYFKKKYNLNYVVYRLSNPYGPGQVVKNNQGVIPSFIQKIQNDESVTIYGDGTSSRDYIHAKDVADMITATFFKDNKHAVYNIGSGKQTTLHNIIESLEALFGKSADVVYLRTPDTFVHKAPLDTSRFEAEFDIRAETDLHSGLSDILSTES